MEYLRKPTQEARRWVQAAQNYEGATLGQVYNRWSAEKQRAYDECYEKFCNEPNSEQFSIILHNSFHFTVSWFSDLGVRIETACRSICIPWECVESMAEH